MAGLKIDYENGTITMGAAFSKKCTNPDNKEYAELQRVRQENPDYNLIVRHIKKNTKKESYAGLTYTYMEKYIQLHENGEALKEVMDEYNELQLVAECHSKGHRYPAIKRWFLNKYPEIAKFGMEDLEEDEDSSSDTSADVQKPAA